MERVKQNNNYLTLTDNQSNYKAHLNDTIVIDKKNVLGGQSELDITGIIVEKLNKELPSINLK